MRRRDSTPGTRRPPIVLVKAAPLEPLGGGGDLSEAMLHNPLLAYPLKQIDPEGTFSRNETEFRLPNVRATLYQLGRDAHNALCASEGDGSLVAALSPATHYHQGIHAAIFSPTAKWQARVCMLAPKVRVFEPCYADKMTEEERVQCIPIEGDARGCVAFPDWPIPAPKRVQVHFEAHRVGVGCHASLTFERLGVDQVVARAVSSNGKRSEWRGKVVECVLDKLFARRDMGTMHQTSTRVPSRPGELPQMLMDEVADFWQRVARCHVVASVCAPEEATRPLGIGSITTRREGSTHKRAVVRAKLHHSSCVCACALWKLKPVHDRNPSERFVSSEVELAIGMCGRTLDPQSKLCPLHGEATPKVALVGNVCCHGTVAELQCLHRTAGKRPPVTGLRQADMRLRGLNVLHAQVLIASCMHCAEGTAPLLSKGGPAEILHQCDVECGNARRKLDEVTRRRALHDDVLSAATLEQLDMKAHDLLTQGGVRQYQRPSTKQLVLARVKPDGSTAVLTAGEGAELADTHLGLFPPPLRTKHKRKV